MGYYGVHVHNNPQQTTTQFEPADHRSPLEVIKMLCKSGYVPSFCTACYRQGRTGDRFMSLAKSGYIHNICLPNALLTLKEYIMDYSDAELTKIGNDVISKQLNNIPDEKIRTTAIERLKEIENGKRDLFF